MNYIQEMRALIGHTRLITVSAGALILDASGRLLLQKTEGDLWGIPGGGMEMGETTEETARREVREETGLALGALELFDVFSGQEGFYTYPNGDEVFNVAVVYLARDVQGTPTADGIESLELRYFTRAELPTLPVSPLNKPVIRQFLESPF
jgi:8-oxo-dGTP pyrophosphatase MutT (NUDIX family)